MPPDTHLTGGTFSVASGGEAPDGTTVDVRLDQSYKVVVIESDHQD